MHSIFGIRSGEIPKICGESESLPQSTKMLCAFAAHISKSTRLGGYVMVSASPQDFSLEQILKHVQEVKGLKFKNGEYYNNVVFCLKGIRLVNKVFLVVNEMAREQFDVYTAKRVNMLDQLWSGLKPGVRRSGLICRDWTELGFQGNDPSTDFRGTGMLGLFQLVYFVEHKTQSAQLVLEESMSTKRSCKFPFVITGISITHFMIDLFSETRLHKVIFDNYVNAPFEGDVASDAADDPQYVERCFNCINDLYCMIFEEFYMLWMVRSPTDIMAFSIIFQELQASTRLKLKALSQL
jgi:hypothetical protein